MRTANPNSPTKKKILDIAEDLMRTKGYVATSVDEICHEAKVTKGSFFHYFKGKEALGKSLIEKFSGERLKGLESCCCGVEDPLERIYACLDGMAMAAEDCAGGKGCLVGTFAQEISETHPELSDMCEEAFKRSVQFFEKALEEAKQKYKPKKEIHPKEMAEFFIAMGQGTLLLAKTMKNKKIVSQNVRQFKAYLKLMFEQ